MIFPLVPSTSNFQESLQDLFFFIFHIVTLNLHRICASFCTLFTCVYVMKDEWGRGEWIKLRKRVGKYAKLGKISSKSRRLFN